MEDQPPVVAQQGDVQVNPGQPPVFGGIPPGGDLPGGAPVFGRLPPGGLPPGGQPPVFGGLPLGEVPPGRVPTFGRGPPVIQGQKAAPLTDKEKRELEDSITYWRKEYEKLKREFNAQRKTHEREIQELEAQSQQSGGIRGDELLQELLEKVDVIQRSVEKQVMLQRQSNKDAKQMTEEPQNFPRFTEVLPIEDGDDLAEIMRNSFPYMSVINPEDIANDPSLRDTFLRVLLTPSGGDYTRQPFWYYQRLRAYLSEILLDDYSKFAFCCIQEFKPIVVRRIDGGANDPNGNPKRTIQHIWEIYRDCISKLYDELPIFSRCYAYLDEINIFGVSTDVAIYPTYTINNDPELAHNMVFTEYPYQCLRYEEFVLLSETNELLLSLEQLMVISDRAYSSVYKYTNDLDLDSVFVARRQITLDDVHSYPFTLVTYNYHAAEYEHDGERYNSLPIPEPVPADTPAEDFQWVLLRIYSALENADDSDPLVEYDEKKEMITKLYDWIFGHPIEDAFYFYNLHEHRLHPATATNIELGRKKYQQRVDQLERQKKIQEEQMQEEHVEREREEVDRENAEAQAKAEREREAERILALARESYDSYMQRLQHEREERARLKAAKRLVRNQMIAEEREKQRSAYDEQRNARKEAREKRMQEKRERIGQEVRRARQLQTRNGGNQGILGGIGRMIGLGGRVLEPGTESLVKQAMNQASSTWDEADMTLNSTNNTNYYIPRQNQSVPTTQKQSRKRTKKSKIFNPIPQRKVKVPVRKVRQIKEVGYFGRERFRNEEYIEMEDRLEDYQLNVTQSMIKLDRTTCTDKIQEFRQVLNVDPMDDISDGIVQCYDELESPLENVRIRSEKLELISDAIGSDLGNKNIPDPKSIPDLATVNGLKYQLKMLSDYYKRTMDLILNLLISTKAVATYNEQRCRVFNQYVCDLIYMLDSYSCLRRLISRNPTAVDTNSIFREAVADAIEYAWSLTYQNTVDGEEEEVDETDEKDVLLYRYDSISLV